MFEEYDLIHDQFILESRYFKDVVLGNYVMLKHFITPITKAQKFDVTGRFSLRCYF